MSSQPIAANIISPRLRVGLLKKFQISEEFAREIEAYVQYQKEHFFAPTTLFHRVRANLFGDVPLAWTGVQAYIYMLIISAGGTQLDRVQHLNWLAFPQARNPKDKIRWIVNNPGIPYTLYCPFSVIHIFPIYVRAYLMYMFFLWHTDAID